MTPMGRAWVRKAEEDRRVLIQLRSARPRVHSSICFHCQQMAEKYLKALVQERGLVVPRTHDCRRLVLLLAPTDPTLTRFDRAAFGLTRYAVGPRYPGLFIDADASRSRSAWNAAERIRAEVRRRLGLRPRP
jgi:HEPN domain-containing protein